MCCGKCTVKESRAEQIQLRAFQSTLCCQHFPHALREESPHFRCEQFDEGLREHGAGHVGVLEVVVGLRDDLEQRRQQAAVLQDALVLVQAVEPPVAHDVLDEVLVLLVVRDVRDGEAGRAVVRVRLELDPQFAGARREGDGRAARLARLERRERVRRRRLAHHEEVGALVLRREPDVGHDDEDASALLRHDAPRALHVGRVLSRPVGTLDEALERPVLASTAPVFARAGVRSSRFVCGRVHGAVDAGIFSRAALVRVVRTDATDLSLVVVVLSGRAANTCLTLTKAGRSSSRGAHSWRTADAGRATVARLERVSLARHARFEPSR